MANKTLAQAAAGTLVRVSGWRDTAVRAITARTRRAAGGGDRGQTALEYLGIILVVVLIIGAIAGSGIGQAVLSRIMQAISSIKSG
ncbi:hypothetical protein [Streptomyces zingiberis]|uniref:Flp family type IVb pilin n=1 Tax=Streptomyces zingiberis TaxID=2053010 RepID=A0ABX1BVQ9_9ACTN|nr:hypothetical protein [Streptomyces zingiberis]NJQ00521.1 hypothetical protein [Streptomyces zingiberis]